MRRTSTPPPHPLGHTWRIDLAWRGDRYVGWQRQPLGTSLQGVVEDALGRLYGGAAIRTRVSGRTDAGVHALQQVVAFRAPAAREPRAVRDGLNHFLPPDVVCLHAAPVPDDFDPRRWTLRKLYRYRILSRRVPCPFRRGLTWHIERPLDVAAMAAAGRYLVGRHDFTSFRASGCTARHPVRRLEKVEVRRAAGPDGAEDEIHLEFTGNGFLRHQVRIMVGTLVDVGWGRRPPDDVARILAARDRRAAGRTARAEGLWLVRVEIGDGPAPWYRSGADDEAPSAGLSKR